MKGKWIVGEEKKKRGRPKIAAAGDGSLNLHREMLRTIVDSIQSQCLVLYCKSIFNAWQCDF